MKNLYCRQLLTQNFQLVPLEKLKKKWNKSCANRETLSGYPVYLFQNLKTLGKKYCVRPDELQFIKKINPYTGKNISFPPYDTTIPIHQEYNPQLCPLTQLIADSEYWFLLSTCPIENIQQLPDQVSVSLSYLNPSLKTIRLKKQVIRMTINPSQIYSLYYYVIKLRPHQGSRIINVIKKQDIIKLYPLYNKQTASTLYQSIESQDLRKELMAYFIYEKQTFTEEAISLMRQLKIRMPVPIKAYRGVLIHSWTDVQTAKLDKIVKGSVFTIDSRGVPVSWSTDSCISQYFATHTAAKSLSTGSNLQFGILYSSILQPQQIALDTRLIDRDYFFKKLYRYDQQEVITFPTLQNGQLNQFECHVERLFIVDVKKKKKVLVHSFQKMIPFLSTHT